MGIISDSLDDFDFESDLIDPLIDNGWFEFVFPFLLIYAIVITILANVEMFEERKPVRVIIGLVVAIFSVSFEITDSGETIGDFMNVLFPGVTAFSIGILALYIVAGMMGLNLMEFFGSSTSDNNIIKYVLGALGLVVVVFYYAKGFGYDYDGSDLQEVVEDPLLYILIVAGLVFYFITRDESDALEQRINERAVEIRDGDKNLTRSQARRRAREEITSNNR